MGGRGREEWKKTKVSSNAVGHEFAFRLQENHMTVDVTLIWCVCVCVCRSVVHRLGVRPDHRPREANIDGAWTHDRFSEHDQLVSYPVHHQQRQEIGRNKTTETAMDTTG